MFFKLRKLLRLSSPGLSVVFDLPVANLPILMSIVESETEKVVGEGGGKCCMSFLILSPRRVFLTNLAKMNIENGLQSKAMLGHESSKRP